MGIGFKIIISLLLIESLLSSCGTAPQIRTINTNDLEKAVQSENIVIVSNAGKINGRNFEEYFLEELARLTMNTSKKPCILSDIEFANSAYNRNEARISLSEILFIFIMVDSVERGEYGTYSVKYLLEVKCMNQLPFLSTEVTLGIANTFIEARHAGARKLAQTIFEELNKRNIL